MSMKKKQSKDNSEVSVTLPVVNAHAAGIDVGSRFHMVSVGQNKDKSVREFGATTPALHDLCVHLQAHGIRQVAMESTGYYWIPLYWMLQSYGFETIVVNPSDVKKFRKTDVLDAMWIQQLHALGLLKSSFQMDNFGETLRTYTRRRRTILQDRNRQMNRMHKVLVLMNIQIGVQLTDLGGAGGMDIIRDIVSGQRDPKKLVAHIRKGVKTPHEELLKALQGTWQPSHLFELKQLLQSYDIATQQIKDCDREIECLLEHWCTENDIPPPDPETPPTKSEKKATRGKNLPPFRVTRMLNQMVGINLLNIGGVNGGVMLDIISETGNDLRQFPSANHYASWLGLAPNTKISGGKVLSSTTPKRTNRAAAAFKQAANAIGRSKQHPLKPFFHAIQKRKGWNGAIGATARKLAVIYYKLVTENIEFDYRAIQQSEEQKKTAALAKIRKSINELNLKPEDIFISAA